MRDKEMWSYQIIITVYDSYVQYFFLLKNLNFMVQFLLSM